MLIQYRYGSETLTTTTSLSCFAGAQPITDKSEDIALSVNGEIYNHVELRY